MFLVLGEGPTGFRDYVVVYRFDLYGTYGGFTLGANLYVTAIRPVAAVNYLGLSKYLETSLRVSWGFYRALCRQQFLPLVSVLLQMAYRTVQLEIMSGNNSPGVMYKSCQFLGCS
jgi:hypothetical protein